MRVRHKIKAARHLPPEKSPKIGRRAGGGGVARSAARDTACLAEERPVRLDLRLHGKTADGRKCQAEVSVYVKSKGELFKEADLAARTAAWAFTDPPHDPIPDGSQITVEHVEKI
jgi:hypothetical protein